MFCPLFLLYKGAYFLLLRSELRCCCVYISCIYSSSCAVVAGDYLSFNILIGWFFSINMAPLCSLL